MSTAAAARAWARGVYPTEAGIELLVRTRLLPPVAVDSETGSVDVDRLLAESDVRSGGEQRVVRIAASLLGGPAVDLNDEIPGLDRPMLSLVLAAIAHANGSHEHSGFSFDADGRPTGLIRHTALYPWPEQVTA